MAYVRLEFQTDLASEYLRQNEIMPMELVRLCGISVTSAYKIANGNPVYDLNVLYKVLTGLRQAGYKLTWLQITGIE